MSKLTVKCKGGGKAVSTTAKRFPCPTCHRNQDVNSNGRIRSHTRVLAKSQLRSMR